MEQALANKPLIVFGQKRSANIMGTSLLGLTILSPSSHITTGKLVGKQQEPPSKIPRYSSSFGRSTKGFRQV